MTEVDVRKNGRPVLEGLRIIDAGTMVAGPFAGTLLADYGADVIKVEKPEVGDPLREWSPMKDGRSLWWKVTSRNKRLVTLDLASERGREIFLRLVDRADAVIENFRPGTFARWGLAYDELAAVNPRIVLLHCSGYGQYGPYAHRPGYGTVAEGISGIPSFTGFPDRPPQLSAFPLADTMAAVFGLVGLLSALYERDVLGGERGQEIDISLYEPVFRLAESQVIGYDQLGIVKKRRGNRLDEDSPRNAYETSDGEWITISASSDRTFARLARAVGRPKLCADPKFATNEARIANDVELDEIVADWIRRRTAREVLDVFDANDVVAGRIYSIADIFEDPHYRARDDIVDVPDEDLGTVKQPGVFPKFSRSRCELRRSGGRLGRDNDEVFAELGFGADELAELRAARVV
jgi:crotonobetainyl-CoA:carnitine CoA-transferase CaiB-like acyl-CoA transferase